MDQAQKDLFIIRRDGILKKKRIIDAIEKLRQAADPNKRIFETNYFYFTEAAKVYSLNSIKDLLESISKMGAVSFHITPSFRSTPWGYTHIKVTILDNFDEISGQIRKEYHELNDKLQVNKNGSNGDNLTNSENRNKAIYYTNPFWLFWKLLINVSKFIKNHITKIIIGIIITVIGGVILSLIL